MARTKAHSRTLRLFFFWSGIIATIAYRIIIVLNFYSSVAVKISWYIGTIGFIVYFIHRYQVSEKRARIIRSQQLLSKVDSMPVSDDDKHAMRYIFRTLSTSKEKWNYVFIFVLSGLALITGIILDFVVPFT